MFSVNRLSAARKRATLTFYLASAPVLDSVHAIEQCAREGSIDRAAIELVEMGARILALKEALAEHRPVPAKS